MSISQILNKINLAHLLKKILEHTECPNITSLKEDIKNGAQGIDEWVAIDKGNAYVLKNYNWVIVDYNVYYSTTVTQLFLEFDTYLCR